MVQMTEKGSWQPLFSLRSLSGINKKKEGNKTENLSYDFVYRISSNKRRASNIRRPLISVALLGIHIEIGASL